MGARPGPHPLVVQCGASGRGIASRNHAGPGANRAGRAPVAPRGRHDECALLLLFPEGAAVLRSQRRRSVAQAREHSPMTHPSVPPLRSTRNSSSERMARHSASERSTGYPCSAAGAAAGTRSKAVRPEHRPSQSGGEKVAGGGSAKTTHNIAAGSRRGALEGRAGLAAALIRPPAGSTTATGIHAPCP